jgi:hypothetical protein
MSCVAAERGGTRWQVRLVASAATPASGRAVSLLIVPRGCLRSAQFHAATVQNQNVTGQRNELLNDGDFSESKGFTRLGRTSLKHGQGAA